MTRLAGIRLRYNPSVTRHDEIALRRSRSHVRLLVFLARKSLLGGKLTFGLLVIAIAAGGGFQVANTANLSGFADALLEDGLTRGAGDIRVEPRNQPRFDDGTAEAKRIGALVSARAATPVLVYPGAVGKAGRFLGAPIYGIEVDSELLPFHLSSGALLGKGDDRGVLLGSALATRLGLAVGDPLELRVIFGPADAAIGEDNVGRFTMIVRGIVVGSGGGYRFAFVERSFLGNLAGAPASASAIVVHLRDHEAASLLAERINASLPEVQAIGWREDDPYLASYLSANHAIHTVSYAMVIAAISIPMWALLYIHVLKRRREIGILSALGFGRGEVFVIHVLQALAVACIGCAIGSLLGYGLIQYFAGHPIFAWESLVVRPVISTATFLVPAIVIVVTAIAAGSYPAWRAARTDPAIVLRRID
ncbi:MAG: putative ABC-type antimicrobial peptide transport system, permease component [Deltaproteobacteria bacterium]|nr:putative ABC-type antimicrobial peptide transport system, permease component [Deltaproteobacteria bacterium]